MQTFQINILFLFHHCFFTTWPNPSALVNNHLLNSIQCAEAIMSGTLYETIEGSSIEIGCDGDSLTVNGVKMVLKKDIVTSNGVIHLIDEVLVPNAGKAILYSILLSLICSIQTYFFEPYCVCLIHFSQRSQGIDGRFSEHFQRLHWCNGFTFYSEFGDTVHPAGSSECCLHRWV